MSTNLQAIVYSRGSLKVLDQLKLPHEVVYIELKDSTDAWKVIRSMQVRGAPLIAMVAVLGLAVELSDENSFADKQKLCDFLLERMNYLRTSRPTAVNLFTATDQLIKMVNGFASNESLSIKETITAYIDEAESMLEADIATNKAIGANGAKRILELTRKRRIKVLTICNTGSLATAGYGTALGVVRALHEQGHLEHVYACETRPYNQGARLTAFEIVQDKLPGTLITDSMAAALMATKGIDCVVVGADRVAANGDTANKIGTYQLAIAAKYHGVPFFAAVPTTTLDLTMADGSAIVVEERPAHELTTIFGQKIAPDGINAWNPAFDVTPSKLIKGIITELGVIEAIGDESAVDYDGVIRIKDFLMSNITQGNDELLLRCENSVTPSSVPSNYTRLDVKKIGHYIFTNPILLDQLKVDAKSIEIYQTDQSIQSDTLKIAEVGDGNLNYVFIVSNITNGQTIVIKQALPYVRCVGESWPLTLERATFEYKALIQESRHTQGKYVPEVYYFDETNALFAMRYIEPPHLILRRALIQQLKITSFASDIGRFLASTLYHTSALAMDGGSLRSAIAQWSRNTAMCALTEKVIFTDPYMDVDINRWTTPQLDAYVFGIRQDLELKLAAAFFKNKFLTSTQALLHADLHTGSIMVKEGSTFCIDPEFAFYGPMGFDTGAIVGNLLLSFFSHYDQGHIEYAEWVLEQIQILYETFHQNFIELFKTQASAYVDQKVVKTGSISVPFVKSGEVYHFDVYNESEMKECLDCYMKTIWSDTLGFAGMKMIRRIVGIAHVADLDSIENPDLRSLCEKKALIFARELVLISSQGNVFSTTSNVGNVRAMTEYTMKFVQSESYRVIYEK